MTRIAVIDDSVETLSFLDTAFRERGWEISPIRDGTAAYEQVKTLQPDAVMVDLWLDRQDRGWEILHQLKSDAVTADIPVIMCSALRETLLSHRTDLDKAAAAVLVKPFSVDELYACLDHVLVAV